MLAKFSSSCLCRVWKAPTVVRSCKTALYNALLRRSFSHRRIPGPLLVSQRYFVRSEMQLERQIDLHTTELNASSEKLGTMNYQDFHEYLFQVIQVTSCNTRNCSIFRRFDIPKVSYSRLGLGNRSLRNIEPSEYRPITAVTTLISSCIFYYNIFHSLFDIIQKCTNICLVLPI